MVKFVHTADIHLDSPLRGLERYEGAPVDRIRGATRRALENLVTLALEERVDFVLIVGDLYDGDLRDYHAGLFFTAQMSRLREAGIATFIVAGNHDAASEITRALRPLENMHILAVKKPETIVLEALGVAVHGQGFAERAIVRNLVPEYPAPIPGLFNIGMLHTCLSGREGHEPYAPCTPIELAGKGYDYWALGHVHQQDIVSREPWIVFPGNIQGRHIRETGPRGCVLVTLEGGRVSSVDPRDLDVIRWRRCQVDVQGARDAEAVLDAVVNSLRRLLADEAGRPLAVRLELIGACRAHAELNRNPLHWLQEVRARVGDASSGQVWLEKVAIRTRTEVSFEQLLARDDAYGSLLRSIQALEAQEDLIADLMGDWEALKARMPPEALRDGDWSMDLPALLFTLRDELPQLLLPRLIHAIA